LTATRTRLSTESVIPWTGIFGAQARCRTARWRGIPWPRPIRRGWSGRSPRRLERQIGLRQRRLCLEDIGDGSHARGVARVSRGEIGAILAYRLEVGVPDRLRGVVAEICLLDGKYDPWTVELCVYDAANVVWRATSNDELCSKSNSSHDTDALGSKSE